jgi:hypothetical protein
VVKVARTIAEIQTDLTRAETMLQDANSVGNEDTINLMGKVVGRLEHEMEPLIRPTNATRLTSIAASEIEMAAFAEEENVSRDLKGALLYIAESLPRRREKYEP